MQFILLLLAAQLVYGDRIVVTNNGPVKGKALQEKNVEAFLGIPYAEPPVGHLRFAKPVPKSSWEETYNAEELTVACVQGVIEELAAALNFKPKMSEDCLYLNVWVPEGGQDIKPIMVHIHGGAFMLGASNTKELDGASLAQHGDVIVASMNYRVGTLGFFSGFIDEAAGNMGMYDQLMAIQWIKDNAKHFGGDPENIVLFGESAGGAAVSFHTISPLSRPLFKRGIIQSGSSFHPMFSDANSVLLTRSQKIANLLGCADDIEALKENPKDVVNCMKNLPAEKFTEKDIILFQNHGILVPRVGDEFLPLNPIDSLRKGDFQKSELLIGIDRDEGSFLLTGFRPKIFGLFGEKASDDSFNETVTREILQSLMDDGDTSKIIESYLDRVRNSSRYSYLNAMNDAFGDFLVTCGSFYEASYKSLHGNPVFFYLFDYRSPASPFPEWMGVPHSAEVPYVLGNPFFVGFSDYEKELSKDIMDMWVAFAKTGNPNIPGGMRWPLYTYEDPKHLVISQRDRVGFRPDNFRCEKWEDYFRAMLNDDKIQIS